METWAEKLEKSKALFAEAKGILENKDSKPEDKQRVEGLMEEAKVLKAEAVALKSIIEEAVAAAEVETKAADADRKKEWRGKPSGFKSWGEFLYAVWEANKGVKVDPRLEFCADDEPKRMPAKGESKTMYESTGAGGGFLVPTEQRMDLQAAEGEGSIVRQRATVIPMRRRQVTLPVLDQTGSTAGVPHWFGGMQFYWAEEGGLKTETTPSFRQIELVAHKMIGYTRASDELLDDSAVSLEAFLSGPLGMAGGIQWMEDYAFLRGTGAGQPLGVIVAGCTITLPRAAQGTIGLADLTNMVEHFLPSGKGLWVYSQSMLSELMQMNGPAANPSYIWLPSARDGAPDVLLGYPAIRTEKVPVWQETGDIGLYDFRYYLVGDRQATTIESTKFDRWQYDETSWRCVHRVDGQPWLSAPLTLQDGTSQVSPFVILGAKAAT